MPDDPREQWRYIPFRKSPIPTKKANRAQVVFAALLGIITVFILDGPDLTLPGFVIGAVTALAADLCLFMWGLVYDMRRRGALGPGPAMVYVPFKRTPVRTAAVILVIAAISTATSIATVYAIRGPIDAVGGVISTIGGFTLAFILNTIVRALHDQRTRRNTP